MMGFSRPPKAGHPTSIRLDRDLRKRLRYQAVSEGRTMAQHIVHILRTATAFVKVPKRFGQPAATADKPDE